MRSFSWGILILLWVGATGCQYEIKKGHYEGNLLWQNSTTPAGDPIGIDVQYDPHPGETHPHHGVIEIRDVKENLITSLEISKIHGKSFSLLVSAVRPDPFLMSYVPSREGASKNSITCFVSDQGWLAQLCFDQGRLTLQISDPNQTGVFKLMANGFAREGAFAFETPMTLRLGTAIHRAIYGNLDSRIAFEHVVQSKLSVDAAYLNLVPHLTSNLIWNAQPSFITVVATLQGLTPFLLPTYWLNAREAQYDLKIKKDADLILKADLAALLEQLSYARHRDTRTAEIQDHALTTVQNFQKFILGLEEKGKLKKGASGSLDSLIEKIKSDRSAVAKLLRDQRYTLSQMLGFHNPEAVEAIEVPEFNPAFLGEPYVNEEFATSARKRAFEIQIIDYSKTIAKQKRAELFFAWIDPSGDPKSSLGLNTIAQYKLASSNLHEWDLKREQFVINTVTNAYRVADEYNEALGALKEQMAREDSKGKSNELETIFETSIRSKKFNPARIRRKVMSYLAAEIAKEGNIAAFRIARSKADRLLLNGYFDYLQPHMPTEFPQFQGKGGQSRGAEIRGLGKAPLDSDEVGSAEVQETLP